MEYLKQLTLTALTMCCDEEMENEKEKKIDSEQFKALIAFLPKIVIILYNLLALFFYSGGAFHVDLVIDCLRCSRNPQTHHHALILLNYAAKRFQVIMNHYLRTTQLRITSLIM